MYNLHVNSENPCRSCDVDCDRREAVASLVDRVLEAIRLTVDEHGKCLHHITLDFSCKPASEQAWDDAIALMRSKRVNEDTERLCAAKKIIKETLSMGIHESHEL